MIAITAHVSVRRWNLQVQAKSLFEVLPALFKEKS